MSSSKPVRYLRSAAGYAGSERIGDDPEIAAGRAADIADHAPAALALFEDPPVAEFDYLFHVGALNPADKNGGYSRSYEGAGLSVSMNPDDWQQIARLSGPVWAFNTHGLPFLDRHDMTAEQVAAAVGWAASEGLVELRPMWRYQWEDCESEQTYSVYAASYEDAVAELECHDDEGEPPVEQTVPVATPLLAERTGQQFHPEEDVTDDAIILFAETRLPVIGVWWEDDYDPEGLSCPRGVIFPGQVAGLDRYKA